MNPPYRKHSSFDRPSTYQIRTQGRVTPDQSDWLGGMTVCVEVTEGGLPVTTLVGELSDQAALLGVLNALYEMHFTVLSVVCISSNLAGNQALSENSPDIKQPGS